METVLTTNGLTKRYGMLPALDGLTLSLPAGKIIGLLGPNGSGKTTLLKLCAGLLTPTSGELTICGQNVGQGTKSLVSYLPDRTYLGGNQRIEEQLDFSLIGILAGIAERMLAELNIDPKTRFQTLSKGNKEKVQLVLVMSRRARLYLLDEPIGGVDPAARDYILNTIINNYDPQATVIISTHLIADVEQVLDEFMFITYGGQILKSGSAEEARMENNCSLDELFREVFRCSQDF